MEAPGVDTISEKGCGPGGRRAGEAPGVESLRTEQ